MINKEIIINKKTRKIVNGENGDLFKLGVDGENLQENLVFKFEDEFVNGTARIEITMQDNTKSYVMINKVNETYILPVKSILTKTGLNKMQLVITQGTDDEEIPIFKSEMFNFFIAESINADTEQPEEYPQWIDKANTTLNEIDNFDIDAIKELNEATITITDRYGLSKSVQVYDGENGQDGKDAKINGVNTLRLLAGNNITIEQEDDELTINAEGGSSGAVNSVNGMTGDVIIEIPDVSDFITKDVDDLTYYEPKSTTANNLVASIDSSTYVMTLTLRNSNNQTLNTQTIDLPLETMVVDGEYDSTNKKIILTLKNGNTIEFSVADLVSGLQSEITSSNKLSADLVDDSLSNNKFQYYGKISELRNQEINNRLDFKLAKKGLYYDDISNISTSYNNSIVNPQSSAIFSIRMTNIYITEEITNLETPSENYYFGYIYGYEDASGEFAVYKLYVDTTGLIKFNSLSPFNSPKMYMLTNNQQEIFGKKKFYVIPEQSNTTAPTTDKQYTNKKYVDDQLATKITQYSTMPTASVDLLDKIVQYIGTTDSTYTNGYFYKCVSDGEETPTYSWENVNVQQGSQSSSEDVYYIDGTSSSNPFIFDGKKKGLYIINDGNTFYYKVSSSSTARSFSGNVINLYLKHDFDYNDTGAYNDFASCIKIAGDGSFKFLSTMWVYGTTIQGNEANIGYLMNTSSQTIRGVKTFNAIPQQSNTNAPTNNAEFTNKKYVDDSINNVVGNINTILATLTTPSNNS